MNHLYINDIVGIDQLKQHNISYTGWKNKDISICQDETDKVFLLEKYGYQTYKLMYILNTDGTFYNRFRPG